MTPWLSASLLCLLALRWSSFSEASHFRYGHIAWAPAAYPYNNNTIRFSFRLAFRRSAIYCDQNIIRNGTLIGQGNVWRAQCRNAYCSSIAIGNTTFRCTDFSVNEDWSVGENTFIFTFPYLDNEWIVSYASCCWISLSRYSGGSWLVSAIVNLTRRSDNGRINSSPLSRSPAIIRWQEGCPQALRIPVEDPDGDVVRCRWATYSESRRYPDSFPYGALDEENCVMTYNGSRGTFGTYAVALTLEDYPAGTTNFSSISPFSAVGIQFLVKISNQYHNGSCDNVPVFTASTPKDGECFELQIGSAFRAVIEVTLADLSKQIVEIVTSSPSGMQITSLRYRGGIYYRNVTWYPGQNQVGQQLFCFKAVDSRGTESELRCVTILVGLSNTPRVILESRSPRSPISKSGPGFQWWRIQFDRVIKKPRTSSYIRLLLLPSNHTVYKVNTLSLYARISSDHTTLQFAMPHAALSMNGSYAILIDHGAVVGQGCSYDGPPTPGIKSISDWRFSVDGICPLGYYLAPPGFTNCVDINECGSHSRSKRSHFYSWWNYTASSSTQWKTYAVNPTATSSFLPFTAPYPAMVNDCFSYPVGVGDTDIIPDNQMNASSYHSYSYFPYYGRLNSTRGYGWCPRTCCDNQDLLQIDFGKTIAICGVATQGHQDSNVGVTEFKLSYSSDGNVWITYLNRNSSEMFFHRNGGGNTVYHHSLPVPLSVRYIRFHPINQTAWNCLRVEVYGTNHIIPTTSSSYVPSSVLYPGSCSSYIYVTSVNVFRSPGYPNCYPNNKDCTWLIEVPSGYFVLLEINRFNLEYGSGNCPNDYLEIRDGNTSSSSLITRLCGSLPYMYMYGSGRFLFIRFRSDGSIRMPGFQAICTARSNRYGNYIRSQQLSVTSSAYCGISDTKSASISTTPYITPRLHRSSYVQRTSSATQIAPTTSSSMSTKHYAQSSSYVLPAPLDFKLHLPVDCAQRCTNTPGSYSCSCVSGYRLASDGKSCIDINECSTNNGECSHHCYNIPGSFYCGCPEGTTMAANNLTCVEPGVTVTCGESNMTVSLEKKTFPFFEVSKLHLRYSSCRATQNSTHLLISTPFGGCGTLVNETEEAIIFWNEIRVDAVIIDNIITRSHDIKLPFYCQYSRRKMLSLSFKPRNVYIGREVGYGNFTFKMDFYKSAAFATPYTDSDYPIEVRLNEYIYVEYSVESSADLVIMAENCKATKDGSFYSWPQYNIIQNGCPRDNTLDYSYDPTRSYQQFKMKTFRFFNDYDTVFFHCELLACHRYSPNSRCKTSCLNNRKRKRRGVTRDEQEQKESTTKKVLTGGPLRIREKQEIEDTGQSNQAALIGGVAGASAVGLIAIIALAVLFVKYRIARLMMNRNKVGDLYTTQDEQMSRKNAYVQEDDMIEKEDSL